MMQPYRTGRPAGRHPASCLPVFAAAAAAGLQAEPAVLLCTAVCRGSSRNAPTPTTAMPRRCWRRCGSTSKRCSAHPGAAPRGRRDPLPLPGPCPNACLPLPTAAAQLEEMRKNEDPRLSFSTPEFKEAQRQFTDAFKVREGWGGVGAREQSGVGAGGVSVFCGFKGDRRHAATSFASPPALPACLPACPPTMQKNFGRPVEYALVKDHAWSTPQLRKLDRPVDVEGNPWPLDAAGNPILK